MKNKALSVLSLFVVLCLMITFPVTVSAASEYVVDNGVLTKYNGSSNTITIPSDVYYIADSVFENNTSITSVNLNGVSIIGNKAFSNCTSLKTVTGGENVTSCGAYAFYNTPFQNSYIGKSLVLGNILVYSSEKDDVIIDPSVVSVAPYAFVNNSGITSVRIGDNVASVGEGAFYNCTSLKDVIVSKYVSYIGAFAFDKTPYLSSLKDDFLILGKGILVDVNTTASEVTIPDSVEQIGAGAFMNNKNLKKVNIPETVTAIGMRAFAGCTALSSADLPESLVLLDKEAFSNCYALKSAVIPSGVSLLGESVFINCTAIKNAKVCAGVSVSKGLFANCSGLEYVMLSEGTESIGEYAFLNCKNIKEMSVPASVKSVADNSFTGASSLSVWCVENSIIDIYCMSKGIKSYAIGDANLDGTVNIRDATEIQKASAKILTMDISACLRGDADFSCEINVRDATAIQKYTAGIV